MYSEKGQVLIELALSLLLLLMILFGITEFGRYFFYANTFKNAARAGVRQAVVTPGLTDIGPTPCPGVAGSIVEYICSTLQPAGLNTSDTTVTVTIIDTTGDGTDGTGDRVQVQVSWGFEILSGSIIPFFSGTRPIIGDASMRYEL